MERYSGFRFTTACLFVLGIFAGSVDAEETVRDIAAKTRPIPPFAALVKVAESNQIPIERIDTVSDENGLNPGDTVTALITFCQPKQRSQWLIFVEVVAPGPKNEPAKPAESTILYSQTGSRLKYASSRKFVQSRTLGPFLESTQATKFREERARFSLDEGYLQLGLDHAAAAMIRLREGGTNAWLGFAGEPYKDAELTKGREIAARMQITSEEERALGGFVPALISYIHVIQNTPGLNSILFKIVDLPPIRSVLRHRGMNIGIWLKPEDTHRADPLLWGAPLGNAAYALPLNLELNDQLALKVTLLVTSPRPPLLACGGVVGLLAEKVGDEQTFMTLRIISARSASGSVTNEEATGREFKETPSRAPGT